MSMSRKHFRAIAESLASHRPGSDASNAERSLWRQIVFDMARTLSQFNDYFKYETFLDACGYYDVPEETTKE